MDAVILTTGSAANAVAVRSVLLATVGTTPNLTTINTNISTDVTVGSTALVSPAAPGNLDSIGIGHLAINTAHSLVFDDRGAATMNTSYSATAPTGSGTFTRTTNGNIDVSVHYTGIDGGGVVVKPVQGNVFGRHIFYNNSFFDDTGNDPGFTDDTAIDNNKVALLPGGPKSTYANYTTYSKGINGIMIDLTADGNHSAITSSDFTFKVMGPGGFGIEQ